ncbi:hypothetical protein RRG08_055251 [Elysia crispata]|uniref:Uncharacterized protein n=1 Tax=Elysia crispata TaxID=231223 RepID=A0AAE0XUL1_9GAST|nr:hypothetical protein RRG08_055251 [Elysia crispata]
MNIITRKNARSDFFRKKNRIYEPRGPVKKSSRKTLLPLIDAQRMLFPRRYLSRGRQTSYPVLPNQNALSKALSLPRKTD